MRVRSNPYLTVRPWQWLPLLVSPFIFGIMVRIFPLDREKAVTAVLLTLVAIALFGLLSRRWMRFTPVVAGSALLSVILSIHFWAVVLKGQSSATPVKAVYSFRAAKADPEAFTKWWNFFVAEVVRTNEVIFTRDYKGVPDYQGLYPRLPIPGARADFYKGHISVNNQGYRGDDFTHTKDNVYRIVTIGDSATFGQTLFPDSRPWPAVLQELIARNLRCSKYVQIENGGVNGYLLRNGIDRLERDYPWLKPDMVLSYFGWNGATEMGINPQIAVPLSAPPGSGRLDLSMWLVKRAAVSLANEVKLHFFRLFSADREKDIEIKMADVRKGELYRQYQKLIEQAERLGYPLVLLSFNTAVAPDGPEEAKSFYQGPWPGVRSIIEQLYLHNIMVKELAGRSEAAHFVDTGANLYGKYDGDLFIDIVHFTPEGDRLMAANVFRGILQLLLRDEELGCQPR